MSSFTNYNKDEIKSYLTIENYFELLNDFGGNPIYTSFGITSETICHNRPGEGSRKLYLYSNSWLFNCFTGCAEPLFDIFELVRKVAKIQWNKNYDLNDAVRWVAAKFGFTATEFKSNKEELEDWSYFNNYEDNKDIHSHNSFLSLKEYDSTILSRLNYNVLISPWIQDGITREVMQKAKIGYYPGGEQITIPHFDINGKFIGLRGRTLIQEDAEKYGKYRPLRVGKDQYNHSLSLNLYGLNWCKNNIKLFQKAIIAESEKSSLLYASYFGWDNNICVACCGSSVSYTQINLLLRTGAKEIIIAFDRQFQSLGDEEFQHLKRNLLKINEKYKNYVQISFIFDKNMITKYKASPLDEGKEKFLKLYNERIIL